MYTLAENIPSYFNAQTFKMIIVIDVKDVFGSFCAHRYALQRKIITDN
jgi:hypothetical protein